jgi:hypothetical protein
LWITLTQHGLKFINIDETVWNALWDLVVDLDDLDRGTNINGLPRSEFVKANFYVRTGRLMNRTKFMEKWVNEFKEYNMIVNCWIPYISGAINIHLMTTNSVRIQEQRSSFFSATKHLKDVERVMKDIQDNHNIITLQSLEEMDGLVNDLVKRITGER